MTVFLKAADLTPEGFLTLLKSLQQPAADTSPRRIWLEAADGWAFHWCPGPEDKLPWCGAGRDPVEERAHDCLARSTAGRLFSPDGELRWRAIPALGASSWRTVFLGNTDWVGAALDDCSDRLTDLHPRRDSFFLWGQQTSETPGEWIELRIPNRFRYPVTGNSRNVKAVVEQWYDDTGEPHFFRLCNLVPTEGET